MSIPGLSTAPACGVSCLVDTLPVSFCGAGNSNTTCLCADDFFVQTVETCVKAACTIPESLIFKNFTSVLCNEPVRDVSASLIGLQAFLCVLQTVAFGLRMLCRAVRMVPWGHDDTTIVISFMATTTFLGIFFQEVHNGLGGDVWKLRAPELDDFIKYFYVAIVTYSFVLATVKISICFLYMRLFPDPRFLRVCKMTQALQFSMLVVFLAFDFTECRPLSAFWTQWDGVRTGQCWDITAFAWSHAAINIALDLWLLALPASQVWGLNMSWSRKIRILSMFAVGIFLTIASIIRLRTISYLNFTSSANPTRDFEGIAVWSSIEITVGVVVACLPAARMVVARYMIEIKTHLSTTRSGSGGSSNAARWAPRSGNWSSRGEGLKATPKNNKLLPNGTDLIRTSGGTFAEFEEGTRRGSQCSIIRKSGEMSKRESVFQETELRSISGEETCSRASPRTPHFDSI